MINDDYVYFVIYISNRRESGGQASEVRSQARQVPGVDGIGKLVII